MRLVFLKPMIVPMMIVLIGKVLQLLGISQSAMYHQFHRKLLKDQVLSVMLRVLYILVLLILLVQKSNTVKSCDSESNHAQESYKSKRNNAKESCENNKQCAEGNFPEKFHRNEDDDQESTLHFDYSKVQVSLNNGQIFNAPLEVVVQEGDHISVGCDHCSYNGYIKYLFKTNLFDYSPPGILPTGNYTTNNIDTSLSFQCCQYDGRWNCSLSTIVNVTKSLSNPCECNCTQLLPITETTTYTETVISITSNDVTLTKFLITDSVISITKSTLGITVHSSISDIVVTSSLSAAPTVTDTVVSSTYTATEMTNLNTTNKTLIITTSAAAGEEKTNEHCTNTRRTSALSSTAILEEKVNVSECQAYGKLDKERVKVSECEAYGKLDQMRITRNTS
uniref:Uncharacterized protein n=2 Tax=Amphimedon queenslandica TaxID=400682 RepID=A0A1X7TWM1_AMPQE